MYYILFYKTVENYVERRRPYRSAHLAMARQAHKNGDLVMAGALEDPADEAVLIFKGDSPEIARQFAQNDPYVKHGLIKDWEVRAWNVVIT